MKRASVLRGASTLAACALLAAALTRCAAPTQVRVTVRTDECVAGATTTITLGVLGGIETKEPGSSSSRCDATGRVGQLVIQPSGAKDAELGFKVVTGVTGSAERCVAPDYRGCVVARRALRFLPHEDLEVVVDMRRACLDNPCDPSSTCVKGVCMSARIADPSVCRSGAPCGEEALVPAREDGGAPVDGGADATSPGDGATPGEGGTLTPPPGTALVAPGGVVVDASGLKASLTRGYFLDKEEVSVARFKRWIAAGRPAPCPSGDCDLDPGGPYSGRMEWHAQWTLDTAFTEPTWESDGPQHTCSSAPGAAPVTRTFTRGDDLPVNCVSHYHAIAFCAWEGKRLPTWVEWQLAWVGRDGARRYPWGAAAIDCAHANTAECDAGVLATGSLPEGATPDGVLHLGGNVAERVWDVPLVGGRYAYPTADLPPDFLGDAAPCGLNFCIGSRLGSWREPRGVVDVTKIRAERLENFDATGFRCAKTAPK